MKCKMPNEMRSTENVLIGHSCFEATMAVNMYHEMNAEPVKSMPVLQEAVFTGYTDYVSPQQMKLIISCLGEFHNTITQLQEKE